MTFARKSGVVIVALAVLCAAGLAAEKTPLSLKRMIEIEMIMDVALSPSGAVAAFTVMSPDWEKNVLTQNVWLAWTDGSRTFPLTRGAHMNAAPAWTPDGERLAFLSSREGAPQVFVYRPGQGEPERLFRYENGVQRFAWSPDGQTLAFLAAEKADPKAGELKKQGYDAERADVSPPRSHLYLFDGRTGAVSPLVEGDFHIIGFSWSPDGSRIAFVTTPKNIEEVAWTEQAMRIVDRGGKKIETLDFKYYGFLSRHGAAVWSPDGRTLALEVGALDKPELSNPIVQAYDFPTGKTSNLSGDADHFMQNCVWSADGRFIYYVAYQSQNRPLFRLDVKTHKLEQLSHFPAMDIGDFSLAADGRTMVFVASTPARPDELYFGKIDAPDAARRLTDVHAGLMAETIICPTEEITWTAEDGLSITGNIVYPAGYEKGRSYPTITLIHGGPAGNFNNSFNANYYCPAQFYAGQGYLVYLPNIRGSIGWGSEFLRKNMYDWGGGDYRDLMAGLDMLIGKGLADPDRLVVWGGSYGGYMTNWIVTQTQRFKAAHTEVSISDLAAMWALSPIGRILSRLYFVKTPLEDPDIYRRLSPVTYARNVKTPLLMTQNEKDQRVGPSPGQDLIFYRALESAGIPVELYVYPGEGHGTRMPSHQLDKHQKGFAWFERFLGRAPEK